MSRLTRDGIAEPVSRGQTLRRERGQRNIHFPCSADHEKDWQHYLVNRYSAICDDHTYIHTYILSLTLVFMLGMSSAFRDGVYIYFLPTSPNAGGL